MHNQTWSEYNKKREKFINDDTTFDEIMDKARELAKEYGYKLNF